ncbi:MAG: hypothetical protein MUQ96_10495, partial [Loktanella sp.]|nr:hypothetical protein [Loktanella sp.]
MFVDKPCDSESAEVTNTQVPWITHLTLHRADAPEVDVNPGTRKPRRAHLAQHQLPVASIRWTM